MTHITTDDEEEPIISLAFNLGVEGYQNLISHIFINFILDIGLLSPDELYKQDYRGRSSYMIFLNGQILGLYKIKEFKFLTKLGIHNQPGKFVKNFRLMRRHGRVKEFVSIYIHYAQQSVYIASDGGRVCR